MYKFLSICFLAAIFAGASAFIAQPANAGNEKPDTMLTVDLTQTAPGTAVGTWTANSGGPFLVTLTNLNTGARQSFPATNALTMTFTNLAVKSTYRLTVGDVNLLFDDEQINF